MNRKWMWMGVWIGGALLAGVSIARADDPKAVKEEVYRMWDVDSMILQAADNVSRRYNLNAQQAAYTRKMMVERVTRFLNENQDQIWPLVRDLARYQLTGAPPDESTAKRIGGSALPIVEKAKQAILEANREWGSILTEEQKRLHEYDLREMEGTFSKVRDNFEQWQTGKPVENPIFPQHVPSADEPPAPPQPHTKFTEGSRKWAIQQGAWAKYVGDFIRKYNLDPGQREAAQSILRELKEDAVEYRDSKKQEYAEVDRRLKEAFDSGDLKRIAAVERDETALNKPINKMFDELRERLDKIPNDAQKERFAQSQTRKRPVRPTTSAPTSRPVLPIVPAAKPSPAAPATPAAEGGGKPKEG